MQDELNLVCERGEVPQNLSNSVFSVEVIKNSYMIVVRTRKSTSVFILLYLQ